MTSNMDAISYVDCQYWLNIARSSFVLPDHAVDLDPGQGDLEGDGLEDHRLL